MRKLLLSILLVSVLALIGSGLAQARPIPINDSARLVAPPPFDASNAAIDGDSILVTANDYVGKRDALFHFRRVGTSWQLESKLLDVPAVDEVPTAFRVIAARDGVAATFLQDRLYVFERSGATWVQRPVIQPQAPEEYVGHTISVDGGRVLVGVAHCALNSSILARNSSGTYAQVGHLTGDPANCANTVHSSGYLSGDFAINSNDRGAKTLYRRNGANVEWLRDITIPRRSVYSGDGDVDYPFAVVGGYYEQFPWRHDASGWTALAPVSPLDRYDILGNTYSSVLRDGLLLTHLFPRSPDVSPNSPGASIYVYRHDDIGVFQHVAILHGSGDVFLNRPEASGRTVISQGWVDDEPPSTIFVFELPAEYDSPDPVHDDFQGSATASWTPLPGTQLAVVTSGHSRVYRQSTVSGDAGAMLDGTDWKNQAVQADFRPWQFSGADRWFGLVVRRQDPDNFYYVTLRNSNQVSLRKRVKGVITELATAPLAVTAGRNYLVRLEARGQELIATVDNGRPLRVFDPSLTHGASGFASYRAAYDVDNVTVSPLATPLLRAPSDDTIIGIADWTLRGGQWKTTVTNNIVYLSQPETTIEGHAVIGTPTDDQIATTHARIDSFNPSFTSGWVGVMNRYVDNRNYYSLVLRSNGYVQLRRTVNGVVTVLAGRGFSVAAGQTYALRLDAVGNRLRGYVNGVLQLETTDTTFARGRNGLASYKAAASFAGYDAWQP